MLTTFDPLSALLPTLADVASRGGSDPDFLMFVNENEGLIQALSVIFYIPTTLVFILATFRANKLSRETLRAMQHASEEEMRPRVLFDLDVGIGGPCYVLLRNIGRSVARNIAVKLTEDINLDEEKRNIPRKLMEMSFIESTQYLVPEREIRSLVAFRSDLLFRENENKAIRGMLSYTDSSGKTFSEEIHIDLDDYVMLSKIVKKDMHDLVMQLEQFQRSYERVHR